MGEEEREEEEERRERRKRKRKERGKDRRKMESGRRDPLLKGNIGGRGASSPGSGIRHHQSAMGTEVKKRAHCRD